MNLTLRFVRRAAAVLVTVGLAACGGGGGASVSAGAAVTPSVPKLSVLTGVAGVRGGGQGYLDGAAAYSAFSAPAGLAFDAGGNLYVADSGNNLIRKISPQGFVTTLAGTAGAPGGADGTGIAASFNGPHGVAIDAASNVYVADTFNNTIRKITPQGVVKTLAGTAGVTGSTDGTGAASSFNLPVGIATDSAGNVYVADGGNNTIRMVTQQGVVTTLAGTVGAGGSADGTGTAASFSSPAGLATDGAGNVYVADGGNNTIRKVTAQGIVTTLAGKAGVTGSADGAGGIASFDLSCCGRYSGLATDGAGNLYVADTNNERIRKITPLGVVTTLAGESPFIGFADGTGSVVRFYNPTGLAADAAGKVYVGDTDNDVIRVVTADGAVTTLTGLGPGSGEPPPSVGLLDPPAALAADGAGNLYAAGSDGTGGVELSKVTPSGVVTSLGPTISGSAFLGYSFLNGLAIDSAGDLYLSGTDFNPYNLVGLPTAGWITKISPQGVSTLLAGGSGTIHCGDGTGSAADFGNPEGLATDRAGNVYVADSGCQTIRKITAQGVVTTLAGTAGVAGSGDGTGKAASFGYPTGVATDSAGNVYVADTGNNTIRMISPEGIVTTLAGTAGVQGSADGTGAAASFKAPAGLAIDSTGNIYVADAGNDTIRKVTPQGVVTTIAGQPGIPGFAPGALPGLLSGANALVGLNVIAISGTTLYTVVTSGVVAMINNVP